MLVRKVLAVLAALVATAALVTAGPAPGGAATSDPFYRYSGATPLSAIKPGTVLNTRTLNYHLAGIALPLRAVQLLFRSADATGRATADVTTVIKPAVRVGTAKLASYQSAYDSLDPADSPSRVIAGDVQLPGGALPTAETGLIVPLLLQGYTVNVPDTEGQEAGFAAGPRYGRVTLDSLRAVYASSSTGVGADTKAALYGYSGGAIATEWAAELAPSYAPEINRRLVGAAMGGVLADPAHNLHYVDGTTVWAGVLPMALIGIAREYRIDLQPYLSAYGRKVFADLQKAPIPDVLGHYPGLTFAKLAKPQYSSPEKIPAYVRVANKLIMGRSGHPTIPLFIGQGAGGETEGSPGTKPGIGRGDGVMIAGDVRTLARTHCAAGTRVRYHQYDALSHVTALAPWAAEAVPWINSRFAGATAPQNCADIAPGNPLTPIRP